jgi:HSP20 family protein|tara:strand:+ start:962 stop:1372 length:411 start_codon:yes stop_codon:yes gene_type:complete
MTTLALRNRNMIDSLFNDVFDDFFTGNTLTRPYMAPTNKTAQVINRDEDWQIVFAVPGVKKDEVEIKIDDHVLTVSYNNKKEDDRYSFVSSFSRSWNVDRDVDVDKIKADHEDGILSITVPKPENKKRVTRIIDIS